MIKYTYTCVILLLIENVSSEDSNTTLDYPCTSNDDCQPERHTTSVICSVCADSSSENGKCIFPFPYMFPKRDVQCPTYTPCPVHCKNGEKRCNRVYAPTCKCFGSFYGTECQYEATANQENIHYVSWLFKGFIPVYEVTEIAFALANRYNRNYRNTRLTLSTSDGYYKTKSGWTEDPGGCYFRSKDCTILRLPIRFPYRMFDHSDADQFITLKNRIVGYYANFSITVVDLGKIIYKKQFQVVVTYEQKVLKCIASIQLTNCAPSTESPTVFTRLSDIDFVSKLLYVSDGGYINTSVADEHCLDGNVFTWKLWSFNGAEETSPPLFENYTNQCWRFDPYSLDIGMYKVLFKLNNVVSLAKNYAYCYFKITSLPLILRVAGGSDRLINLNSGLYLSAVHSSDPNMPASNQHGLMVEWSCKRIEPPTNYDPICETTVMSADTPYFIPPVMLKYSAVYNFTLKLWSSLYTNCHNCKVEPQFAFVRIQVGNETSNKSISIQCVENCEDRVNPNESLLLKVTSDDTNITETDFGWTYSKASGEVQCLNIYNGMPSFMLLLEGGFLNNGTGYTITALNIHNDAYAKYVFVTDNLVYHEQCKVEPQKGTRGLTEFDITCPLKRDYALIFEFYDKSFEDTKAKNSFNGRMLATSSTGELQNVRLTRGYVIVTITNSRGFSIMQEIKVELSDWDITPDIIMDLRKNLTDSLIYFSNERNVVRLSSLITDILPHKEGSNFNFLLWSLSEITIDTFPRVKILSSTLYIVLTGFNMPTQLELQTDSLLNALDFISELTNEFRQSVFNRGSSQYTPSKIIKEIAEIILQCFSLTCKCKGNKTLNVEQEQMMFNDVVAIRYSSYFIENIIDNLKDVLTFIQYPGKPPLKISTNNDDMKIWAITNDINYPISEILNKNYHIPVSIPIALMKSLINKISKYVDVSIQSAYIGGHDFMRFRSDIKSNLVSVSLTTRKGANDIRYIRELQQPLSIRMTMDDNLENIKLKGSITQADSSLPQDYLDMQVKIHRLDIKARGFMNILFKYPPTNGSLRVSVMEEYRPDYSHMIKHSTTISKESAKYPHPYHEYDEPRFFYVGIIPGKDVPVNQTVSYTFEVNTTLCQYWSRSSWKSDGCLVYHHTQGKEVTCQCTHLSTFGMAFLVPPQQVDPFGDAKLFLTVLDNPLVVSLVVTFLVIYFILCILLRRVDKKDEIKNNVIVLKDNFAFDTHPYLISVFTSSRLNAGTTANVGVKLIGSEAESRSHILQSNERKVLKAGSDDWFLINSPKHLGEIRILHLWHDSSGWSPSWYCDNIYVYDLINRTETKFIVKQWLALNSTARKEDLCYPEAKVLPSEGEDISSVKSKFLDNIILGIRDGHRVMRVFYRHPRSQVTRLQCLSVVMLYIMVAMLCSIMFYIPDDETEIGVDDYSYSVGTKEFVISVQSLVISALLTSMVLFSFKRSFKLKKYNGDGRSTQSSDYSQNKQTLYSNFMRYATPIMKSRPLNPVQLPKSPQVVEQRKFWLMLAWVSCITIILLCAYFVMLYGLKLGSVKSMKWLSSVLLAVSEDALITAPAKIVLFAVGLTITFQLIVDINTYQINIYGDLFKRNLEESSDDIIKPLNTRKNLMYAPLNRTNRLKIIKNRQIWSDWWKCAELLLTVTFVIVTCNVIYFLWSSHYYTNNHIRHMIADTKYPVFNSITFYNVSNVKKLENYVENSLIYAVYNLWWYNRKLIIDSSYEEYKYWTSDFTNKLVGRPKVRQLRSEAVSCSNIVTKNGSCIQVWRESTEDTNIYSKGWNPGTYIDVHKEDSYWVYREQSSLFKPTLDRFYGRSGRLFHDGGYTVTLGPTRLDAEQILDELKNDGWQDEKTRIVFVEFTTFNGNKALFSQVTLVVEYLITGIVLLKAQVFSVSSIFEVNLWNILFIAFITIHILKTVYSISYYGLLDYLSGRLHNITDVINVILGITTITLFCIHLYTTSDYTSKLGESAYDEYFEFDSFVRYFVFLQISLSILLGILIIKVIGSIHFGKSWMLQYCTFIISVGFLYCMIFLISLVYFMYKQWTLLLGITSFSVKELFVNSNSFMYVTNQQLQNTKMKVFILLKILIVCAINSVFLLIFVNNTRMSKTYVFSFTQRFNFLTFIIERIINRWNKIISK